MAAASQMATMPTTILPSSVKEKADSIPEETKTSGDPIDHRAGDENGPGSLLGARKTPFYRTVFFNLCIVGMCAFLCPGIFNASE